VNSPERRLQVAFIGGRGVGSAYSGIERYYEEVGSRLAEQGHRVLVYCRSHFSPAVEVYRGMELKRFPTLRSKHLETLVHTLLATLDVCFRRVDIVQFHALGSSPFAWIPRLFGKQSVVSVRGLDWQRAKWGRLARGYLRFCEWTSIIGPNATVVVSRTLQHYFRKRFGREVWFIPNGVNRTVLRPPDAIRRWGLDRRNYLLYAGRISPEKNLETLLEAHRKVNRECMLVMAGGSSYSEAYIEALKGKAGSRVLFTGFQTGKVLEELYSNALAFVLPSQMEGLSVALLEAMSYGLPVIASDIPENRELVLECGGFLFRLDDPESLVRTIQEVLANPSAARRIGETACVKCRERFDWDRIAQNTQDLYYHLLGAPVAPESHPSTESGYRSITEGT